MERASYVDSRSVAYIRCVIDVMEIRRIIIADPVYDSWLLMSPESPVLSLLCMIDKYMNRDS